METSNHQYDGGRRDPYTRLDQHADIADVEMADWQNHHDNQSSENEGVHHQSSHKPQIQFYDSITRLYDTDHHGHKMMGTGPDARTTERLDKVIYEKDYMRPHSKLLPFLALIPTLSLGTALLVGIRRNWTAPSSTYHFISTNRTVTQVSVQIISYALGLLNMLVICRLLQYAVRIRLSSRSISLHSLRFWTGLLSQKLYSVENLPFHLFIPLLLFCTASLIPSAVWTGALTPVQITINETAVISLPSYQSTELLVTNWTERFGSQTRQTNQGFFTYNVGEQYMPHLMSSLATATTVDGSPRIHSKLDNTGYSFVGRSYGVGVSVGLVDDILEKMPRATGYTYEETGYLPDASCAYNASAAFALSCQDMTYFMICYAQGYLPNSAPGQEEGLSYLVDEPDTIAAMAVTSNPDRPGRILAATAGSKYADLNRTQCEWAFTPTRFRVSVDFAGKNISVVPLLPGGSSSAAAVDDMEPNGNLTFLANWQFNLMSSDLSSRYSSFLGKSINANIQNYEFAHNTTKTTLNSTGINEVLLTDDQVVLGGLEAALEAAMDDLLLGYAGAQLMVAGINTSTEANLSVQALRFGQESWIVGAVAFNVVLLLWTIIEAVRTRGWRCLEGFDFTDSAELVMGVAKDIRRGGVVVDRGQLYYQIGGGSAAGIRKRDIGAFRVSQRGDAVVLWNAQTRDVI